MPDSGAVGLLRIIADQPSMPAAKCRHEHLVFDRAASGDPLAAERAVQLCHQCPCINPCAEWAATLSAQQRSALGVLAGSLSRPKSRRHRSSRR